MPPTDKTLLVVEDDPIFREGLALILRKEGYTAVLAADGQQALDCLRTGPSPHLILLDMMMEAPACDGWRFLELRRGLPAAASVPLVIVTALGVASPEWAGGLGAVGLLKKPVSIEHLLEEVARSCRG